MFGIKKAQTAPAPRITPEQVMLAVRALRAGGMSLPEAAAEATMALTPEECEAVTAAYLRGEL